MIAQIMIEDASPSFDQFYSYNVPDDLTVSVGVRVRVPFGRKNKVRTGFIMALEDEESASLKKIESVVDQTPLLNEEGIKLVHYLKQTTFCTWFDAVRLLVPSGLGVKGIRIYCLGVPARRVLSWNEQEILQFLSAKKNPVEEKVFFEQLDWAKNSDELGQLLEEGIVCCEEKLKRKVSDEKIAMVRLNELLPETKITKRQLEVLDYLKEKQPVSLKEALYYTKASRSVFDKLKVAGFLDYYEELRWRGSFSQACVDESSAFVLSEEQNNVFEILLKQMQQSSPQPALLYGVTGSGKTQVFLALVEEVVQQAKGVIVMVPEISLTSQTVRTLQNKFGNLVAVLHSGLSPAQRMDEWNRIRKGEASVVVGTRSAVFAPLQKIGLIVLDEEQEHTYKSDQSPRFHARDIAKVRCKYHNALLLLCSATPSVESFYQAQMGKYQLVELHHRFGEAILPEITVVDMKQIENLSHSMSLSETLLEEIHYNLEHQEQTILLLNRRGYSTTVQCASCKQAVECPSCSVSMTYHTANDSMLCHYCGHHETRPTQCPHCGSELVRYTGIGTQKLQEEIQELFPQARILRMDMDTTMSRFSHEKMFDQFLAQEYDIMIGTQMVAKGLNFPKVTLVGVINADQSLYSDNFRSYERTFSLLTQVVGRSGRGKDAGRAFIQTHTPDHPVIELATRQDYVGFYRQEILARQMNLYPPFCNLTGIGFVGSSEKQVQQWAYAYSKEFQRVAREHYSNLPIRVLGPSQGEMFKVAGKYRYKLIIKCRNDKHTRELLLRMQTWFYQKCRTVSLIIDRYFEQI